MCKGPGVDVRAERSCCGEEGRWKGGTVCAKALGLRGEEAVVGRGEGEGRNSVCNGPEVDMRDGRKPPEAGVGGRG